MSTNVWENLAEDKWTLHRAHRSCLVTCTGMSEHLSLLLMPCTIITPPWHSALETEQPAAALGEHRERGRADLRSRTLAA